MHNRACRSVLEYDLPRPLHASHRQRLRLDLIAAMLVLSDPALLLPQQRRGNGGGERREQHRHDHGGAAQCRSSGRVGKQDHQRSASHRSIVSPDDSVSCTRTARGKSASPTTGHRSIQALSRVR